MVVTDGSGCDEHRDAIQLQRQQAAAAEAEAGAGAAAAAAVPVTTPSQQQLQAARTSADWRLVNSTVTVIVTVIAMWMLSLLFEGCMCRVFFYKKWFQ